ncbi:type II secretion system protein M [Massilia agilis]|uniref:Type II secretion system protein M n=1 Tax=Massilia agilis TaxID=1811226 RepID=A0ABT2DGN1_9BURK|nr:type II secretion system protein M [Massilia agilis]MCS0810477.1 type II secretion system protein M [Massilia agilis]
MSIYAGKNFKGYLDQAGTGPKRHARRPAGLVDNRAQSTVQRQQQALASSSPGVQEAVQLRSSASVTPASQSASQVVQRVVDPYKPGRALQSNYKVMRHMSPQQMKYIQGLHEEAKHYSSDEAVKLAQGTTSANKFEWDVDNNLGSYQSPHADIQSILNSYGHPTTDVVKVYDDLANRIKFDVGSGGKGKLQQGTASDLHLLFDAAAPLHFATNKTLGNLWQDNLDGYGGKKTGSGLYSVLRSEITKDFKAEDVGHATLNDVLKSVSGKPPELHHLEYKSLFPQHAHKANNLMLTERSDSESRSGMGQHELMHWVASGANPNKFKVLLPQYQEEYEKWVKKTTGGGL